MIPSVNDVFARNRNKVVEDILERTGKAMADIKIDLEHVNTFDLVIPTEIKRPLSHGERLALKLALGWHGWGCTFQLRTMEEEVMLVYVLQ